MEGVLLLVHSHHEYVFERVLRVIGSKTTWDYARDKSPISFYFAFTKGNLRGWIMPRIIK